MGDLLGADYSLVEKNALYRCLDKLVEHKQAMFNHLSQRWQDLFGAQFEVLLYDLTSTYFESAPPEDAADKRHYGYSRDKRGDCVQVVIALIVTPDGFPLAYEVLPGNTADKTTLRGFLGRIEAQYGKAQRIWVMDRGIPTEAVLAEMRAADPPVHYLVGTPKGRLSKLEQALLDKPWQAVRPDVDVKLLAEEQELYVLAPSARRVDKERAMRWRKLKWLWARLKQLSAMKLEREALLIKHGGARAKAPAAWRLVDVEIAPHGTSIQLCLEPQQACARSGGVKADISCAATCLAASRPSCGSSHPARRDRGRLQEPQGRSPTAACLPSAGASYRSPYLRRLHGLLPAWHPSRPPAPARRRPHAPRGPRQARRHQDARRALPHHRRPNLILTRHTEPNADHKIILHQLKLHLPAQPPPRITAAQRISPAPALAL